MKKIEMNSNAKDIQLYHGLLQYNIATYNNILQKHKIAK